MATNIKHEINENGNHQISFRCDLSRETSYTRTALGNHEQTMELWLPENTTKKNGTGSIEWCVEALDEVQSIGVWWENGKLTDFDGVYDFPKEAKFLMRKFGVTIPRDF